MNEEQQEILYPYRLGGSDEPALAPRQSRLARLFAERLSLAGLAKWMLETESDGVVLNLLELSGVQDHEGAVESARALLHMDEPWRPFGPDPRPRPEPEDDDDE